MDNQQKSAMSLNVETSQFVNEEAHVTIVSKHQNIFRVLRIEDTLKPENIYLGEDDVGNNCTISYTIQSNIIQHLTFVFIKRVLLFLYL